MLELSELYVLTFNIEIRRSPLGGGGGPRRLATLRLLAHGNPDEQ
jgi:hypothetical protein